MRRLVYISPQRMQRLQEEGQIYFDSADQRFYAHDTESHARPSPVDLDDRQQVTDGKLSFLRGVANDYEPFVRQER